MRKNGKQALLRRRNAAVIRAREAEGRTPSIQIARLDEKLGKGVGAVRERARLQNARAAVKGAKRVAERSVQP